MGGQPAPQAVLDLLACTCSRSYKLPECVLLIGGLSCKDMCKLTDCDNQQLNSETEDIPNENGNCYDDDDDDDELWFSAL